MTTKDKTKVPHLVCGVDKMPTLGDVFRLVSDVHSDKAEDYDLVILKRTDFDHLLELGWREMGNVIS